MNSRLPAEKGHSPFAKRPTLTASATLDAEEVDGRIVALEAENEALRRGRDLLAGELRVQKALTDRVRDSYARRVGAQTGTSVALAGIIETIMESLGEISVAYTEMLKAVQDLGRIAAEFSLSFSGQLEMEASVLDEIEGVNRSALIETASSRDLRVDIDNIQAIQRFIVETIDHIEEISSRLSLLSINGRIEASHAGTFGAGFRIVAKEISKLQEENQTLIEGQRLRVKEFLPLMKRMQERSTTVEGAAEAQKDTLQKIAESSRENRDRNQRNLESLGALSSAVDQLASSVEEGERTVQGVNGEAAKVRRIFSEEVFVAGKVQALDDFIFRASREASSIAEAAHGIVNEYQKMSVINGASYVWQAESWLIADASRLPATLRAKLDVAALGPRVLVQVGQTDNNPLRSPLAPEWGIIDVRPLGELKDSRSPLFGLNAFFDRVKLSYEDLADPTRLRDPLDHAGMCVVESFSGAYAHTLSEKIRKGHLICHFSFGGMFSNGDVVVNNLLSTYQRSESDADNFGMLGNFLVFGLNSFAASGRYWAK